MRLPCSVGMPPALARLPTLQACGAGSWGGLPCLLGVPGRPGLALRFAGLGRGNLG